jgi:NDP-sugar pyrophosphorylase family protein
VLKQAVIFCGGLGTRLLPLTKKIPKPMTMVDGKPFLYHLISQSKQNGIKNFLILCGYKHELIIKYFGDGSKFGVKIKYHYNKPEIQTFKRLLNARHLLKKSFLLLYGDNYSSLNLHDLSNQKSFKKNSILLTICKKKSYGKI